MNVQPERGSCSAIRCVDALERGPPHISNSLWHVQKQACASRTPDTFMRSVNYDRVRHGSLSETWSNIGDLFDMRRGQEMPRPDTRAAPSQTQALALGSAVDPLQGRCYFCIVLQKRANAKACRRKTRRSDIAGTQARRTDWRRRPCFSSACDPAGGSHGKQIRVQSKAIPQSDGWGRGACGAIHPASTSARPH